MKKHALKSLILFLLVFTVDAMAFQETISSQQEAMIVDALDGFSANSGKCDHYAVAIDFTSWDLEGKDIGVPYELHGEVMIFMDEKTKFRRVTYRREVVNSEQSVQLPWRTEIRDKGLLKTIATNGAEKTKSLSFLANFDPFEISVGTWDSVNEGICNTGYFVSSVDVENVVFSKTDAIGNLAFVFQRWPNCQKTIAMSEKQGGLPVKTMMKLAMDKKTDRLKVSKNPRDYNFLLGVTNCKWEKFEDFWVPTWIQMDRVYDDEKGEAKKRYQFELRWSLGESLKKFDRKRLESFDTKIETLLFNEIRLASVVGP